MSPKSKRPRLLYSKEDLQKAIADIKAGTPVQTASKKYRVPRTTLHNKMTSRYADKRPGPETVLTTAEENALVQWIVDSGKQGLMVSKQQLLNSVAFLVKSLNRENPFSDGRPGRHWYQSFLRRHEDIASRINENTALAKASALETDIRNWFYNLRLHLERKNLLFLSSSRIFTTETCELFSMGANKEDRENFQVQMAGGADGWLVPPMLLLNCQRIPSKIYDSLPQGWACSKTNCGCITPEIFYEYMKKHFYPWLIKRDVKFPIVLFIDGKAPYLTLSLSDFCLRSKIELIGLLPNSSHVLQPLNVALYSPMKKAWKKELNNFCLQNKASNSLKENMIPLLKKVLEDINCNKLLRNGFTASGLYPLRENAVNFRKVPPKFEQKTKTEQREFIPYMPNEIFEEKEEQNSDIEICVYTLHHLEQWLGVDKLELFNNAFEHEKWTGRIEDESLFYYWRKIRNEVDNLNFDSTNSDISCETVIIEANIDSSSNESKSDDGVENIPEDSIKQYFTKSEEL